MSHRSIVCASLERRLCFSASPAILLSPLEPIIDDFGSPADSSLGQDLAAVTCEGSPGQESGPASGGELAQARELIVFDPRVPAWTSLAHGLAAAEMPRTADVLVLREMEDPFSQITRRLAELDQVSAIHLFSHGSRDGLELGGSILTLTDLKAHAAEIVSWRDYLTADADWLIYGCDLAATSEGQSLLAALAELSGADVAASSNLTGHHLLHGDWDLEFQTGFIQSVNPFAPQVLYGWVHHLSTATLASTGELQISPNLNVHQMTSHTDRGSHRAVAMDGEGNYVVVWSAANRDGSGWGVYSQRIDRHGRQLGPEFRVNVVTSNDQQWASVAMDASGRFAVVWTSRNQDGSGNGVYLRRFQADGTAIDAVDVLVNWQVVNGHQTAPSLAMNAAGEMVIAWEHAGSPTQIHMQRFNMTAATVSGRLPHTLTVVDTGSNLANPSVDINSSGNFVVAWQKDNKPFAQRYNAAGNPLGSAIDLNPLNIVGGTEKYPVVALHDNGEFAVAYRSEIIPGIWWNRFRSDGTSYGLPRSVSLDPSHTAPSLAKDAMGNLIVTYEGDGDGSGKRIFGRKYSADGSSLGAAFPVNVSNLNDQHMASLAMSDVNHFVVVWTGRKANNAHAVFARQFGTPNSPLGPVTDFDMAANQVAEHAAPGTFVGITARAIDPDAADSVTYSLDEDAGGRFTIEETSGLVRVANGLLLDYETATSHSIVVRATSFDGTTSTASFTIQVLPVNEAPELFDTDVRLPVVSQLAGPPTGPKGTLVSHLVDFVGGAGQNNVRDVDSSTTGMAVVAVNTAAGSWYYSTDNGLNWSSFGSVDPQHARLLAADHATRIYFQPNGTFVGSITQGLTFHAWDASAGLNGSLADLSQVGGLTPFSEAVDYVSLRVQANNATPPQFLVHAPHPNDDLTNLSGRGSHRAVAMAPNGNFVVVWSRSTTASDWNVFARMFDDLGNAISPEIQVNQTAVGNQQWATVAVDRSGNFVVAWTSEGQDSGGPSPYGIYARRFSAHGDPLTGEISVNTVVSGNQFNPTIAMSDTGSFVVVWQGNGPGHANGIFARRFSAAGLALDATEFRVNTDVSRSQFDPAVAMNAQGAFVVVWDNNVGFLAQRFATDGTKIGGEIVVDPSPSAGNGSVALHADGSFVTVWRETVSGSRDVLLQRFNSAGAAVGSQVLVNTSTDMDQTDPSLAMDEDGNFIVVWEGNGTQTGQADTAGVFGQRFRADGSRLGTEFRLNQGTAHVQNQVSVAMLSLDQIATVWTGSDGSQTDIYARLFYNRLNSPPVITRRSFDVLENMVSVGTVSVVDPDLPGGQHHLVDCGDRRG